MSDEYLYVYILIPITNICYRILYLDIFPLSLQYPTTISQLCTAKRPLQLGARGKWSWVAMAKAIKAT